jgi:hypothetical protein
MEQALRWPFEDLSDQAELAKAIQLRDAGGDGGRSPQVSEGSTTNTSIGIGNRPWRSSRAR